MALPPRNMLDRETSPYLLQHKNNPVHWRAWGAEALAEARAASKPILLSVGYAACHWCHVMAHESFEDDATARVMNELFVNIKVDREERPDIDTIYQTALALLGESGGWPLTMFLTPKGEPFWGGTYFPSTPRYGRPGFSDVLRRVAEIYHSDTAMITQNRDALMAALVKRGEPAAGAAPAITPNLLNDIAHRLLREIDPIYGGIGSAPKFPQCGVLELLWRAYRRTGEAAYSRAVTLTLDRMCQGGIYDHLGGGFARYSTDAQWLAPHFEKMLYDNALMLDLLASVWAEAGTDLYRRRAEETVAWLLREMRAGSPGGDLPSPAEAGEASAGAALGVTSGAPRAPGDGQAFAASQDADSEGVEGRFYVWDSAEIDRLLGARADAFKAAYDVKDGGNWEGHTILNRAARPELGTPDAERLLGECRAVLFAAREQRIKPGWDDKVLADWNGLMITALVNAGMTFERPDWIAAAAEAFAFIVGRMSQNERLLHSYRDGRARHSALLDDYANMSRAALSLSEATGERIYVERAKNWVATLDRYYWDTVHGGYYYTAADAEALIARTRNCADQAIPAGNGTMVGVLARLWHFTGDDAYRQRAEQIIAAFAPELGRNFFPLATLLNASETFFAALQIVIIGQRGAPDIEALLRVAHGSAQPDRVLMVVPPGAALPDTHPAAGKSAIDGKATAYLCRGATCSAPVTDAAALRMALAQS